MVSHTGPTRFALFLLCCMGTLLAVHMAPIPGSDLRKIFIELKASSEKLLENYKEIGLSKSTPYPLQSFASYCQPPHYINSSAILPYFKAIQPSFSNKADIDDIIEQLDKLKSPHGPETKVSVPTDSFECKRFISAILQEFSTCMKSF